MEPAISIMCWHFMGMCVCCRPPFLNFFFYRNRFFSLKFNLILIELKLGNGTFCEMGYSPFPKKVNHTKNTSIFCCICRTITVVFPVIHSSCIFWAPFLYCQSKIKFLETLANSYTMNSWSCGINSGLNEEDGYLTCNASTSKPALVMGTILKVPAVSWRSPLLSGNDYGKLPQVFQKALCWT